MQLLFESKRPRLKVAGEIANSLPPNVMDTVALVSQGTNINVYESVKQHLGYELRDNVLVQTPLAPCWAEPGMLL
jgi:hypothetical protein